MSTQTHKNRSVLLDATPTPVETIPPAGKGRQGAFKKSQNRYKRLVKQLSPTPGVPHRIGAMRAATPYSTREAHRAAASLRTTLLRYGVKVEARKVDDEVIFYGTYVNGQ